MEKKSLIIIIIAIVITIVAVIVYLLFSLPSKPLGPEAISNVVVFSPKAGDRIQLPFKVRGKARVFEGNVSFEIHDKKTNKLIFEDWAQTNAQEMGEFGDFEKEIDYLFKKPETEDIILEVFWSSPKDGSKLDVNSIPLKIDTQNMTVVKLFFNNDNLDPEFSCNKVFPVERVIAKTQTPARKALELLLKGHSSVDMDQGFLTNINPDVKIQSLTIENGVAKVDFNDQLEFQVGGSCRAAAIRAEITQTLKQFSTVKEVIISINGRTEDILQP